ncbi:beta-galactosidase trimerization domain-containing protein [Streptomyces tuirus]|uniref:beta-galactosidase trimerization domain-containing protein n=1 Tax=Streptomyces tuirus TaxID=68278 RepID=UPI0034299817
MPLCFRQALGVRWDEPFPLQPAESVRLSGGGTASLWSERLRLEGAQAVMSYAEGPLTDVPVVTRHAHGQGMNWNLTRQPDAATHSSLLDRIRTEAGRGTGPLGTGIYFHRAARPAGARGRGRR